MDEKGELIEDLSRKYSTEILSKIPTDMAILKSYSEGLPVVNSFPDSQASKAFRDLYNKLEELIW